MPDATVATKNKVKKKSLERQTEIIKKTIKKEVKKERKIKKTNNKPQLAFETITSGELVWRAAIDWLFRTNVNAVAYKN